MISIYPFLGPRTAAAAAGCFFFPSSSSSSSLHPWRKMDKNVGNAVIKIDCKNFMVTFMLIDCVRVGGCLYKRGHIVTCIIWLISCLKFNHRTLCKRCFENGRQTMYLYYWSIVFCFSQRTQIRSIPICFQKQLLTPSLTHDPCRPKMFVISWGIRAQRLFLKKITKNHEISIFFVFFSKKLEFWRFFELLVFTTLQKIN